MQFRLIDVIAMIAAIAAGIGLGHAMPHIMRYQPPSANAEIVVPKD